MAVPYEAKAAKVDRPHSGFSRPQPVGIESFPFWLLELLPLVVSITHMLVY